MKADTNPRAVCAAIRYREPASKARWAPMPSPARQRGMALIAVLLLMLVSLSIGLLSATAARTELSIAHNDVLDKRALAVAEAGINQTRQLIAAHDVLNDELANNGVGACTGNGVGTATSGLSNIGIAKTLASDGLCYRFAAFGGAATDGYYIRVVDNKDEATGADDPLTDIDGIIGVVSHGVVGTAERIVEAIYTIVPAWGVYATHDLKISASTIGSASHPLNAGAGHSITQDSPPGGQPYAVYGSGVYGTAVADATKFSGGVTQAAALTLPALADCTPFSPNAGISGSYTYNAGTGDLTASGAIVILASGTYCFHQVTVSGGSGRLQVDGLTTINLSGTLTFSGGAQVNNTTGNPDNLIVNSSNTTNNAVTVSGGSGTFMRINAPNPTSKVTVSGGASAFNGSISAYDIDVTGGAHVLNATAAPTVKLTNWHEVQN